MAINSEYLPLMRLWALRFLVSPYATQAVRHGFVWQNEALQLDLPCPATEGRFSLGGGGNTITPSEFWKLEEAEKIAGFGELLRAHQSEQPQKPESTVLSRNIARLASHLNLSQTEQDILLFAVLVRQEPALTAMFDAAERLTRLACVQVVARALGLPEAEAQKAFSSEGRLAKTGILKLSAEIEDFSRKVELLPGLSSQMQEEHADTIDILEGYLVGSKSGKHDLSAFSYLGDDLQIVLARLEDALSNRARGVNILLYGTPGCGKTELVRTLSRELSAAAYEVPTKDIYGDPLVSHGRFRYFMFSQSLLDMAGQCLIVFDEIEDVFPKPSEWLVRKDKPAENKAFMNELLETNPVPTVWLSNSIDLFDPAYLRRFDYVLELKTPPYAVREQLIRQHVPEVGTDWAHQAAACEHLTPALIERSAAVYSSVREQIPDSDRQAVLTRIMETSLKAQGKKRGLGLKAAGGLDYDPGYLNADCDLASLGEGLLESREGRLCLYGPPGTGKTAYGHYLARLLGQPLLVKRASDLISMWVGETEKNIADAFDRAEMDKSVLLIDEADSFLMDRQQARNSWEVTQVNEMLTCMENFKGIFIASTNLMDNLDKASVRRFDLKVCFGFLLPEQAWRLFENLCSILSLPAPAPELKARLARISGITPGNYATVARQSRLRRIRNCEDALEALRQESELNQEGHGRKIGFAV